MPYSRLGGLGLRRVVERANLAYHASWYEAQKTAKEVWSPPPNLPAEYISQKEASFKFDETMQAFLIDNADVREAQRLRRVAQPHACGFITAVPSDEDGKETLLRPRNFQIAVAYRLGIPVLNQEIPCPLCKQPINKFGDHATCCLFVTTRCVTWSTVLLQMLCSLPLWKRREFLAIQVVNVQATSHFKSGWTGKALLLM